MDVNQSPLERYRIELTKAGFNYDPVQEAAVVLTDNLYKKLIVPPITIVENQNFMSRFFKKNNDSVVNKVHGLYLWGGVGRGKTFIVDNFFHSLPFDEKKRIHFHRFMQDVHNELKNNKYRVEPLEIIAEDFSKQYRVLCFDEFHVSDITDAMLLGKLLKGLFERGVCLIATSNDHPDSLYSGGLQRSRFLPAIEMIKSHTEVFEVDNGIDYRFRVLEKAEIYHYPLDETSHLRLQENFLQLSPDEPDKEKHIVIEGRKINALNKSDGVIWFGFKEVCDGPRGAADYIEIAREFQTVLISGIPVMSTENDDQARRFMTMIDEFYDRNVKVIMTAEVGIHDLYTGKRLEQSFKRTISRLQEMCTLEYLKRTHHG